MPSRVHKLLIHGPDIIKGAILPIGKFSEKSLEVRNKDFRCYKQDNTGKFLRIATMSDLLNTLLYSSNPVISTISKRNNVRLCNNKKLNKDVSLLLE